jgi:hypothetical protein
LLGLTLSGLAGVESLPTSEPAAQMLKEQGVFDF